MYQHQVMDHPAGSVPGLLEGGVTAVIPTYNSERTIARSVRSVFRQDCGKLSKILVVDDCSTDRTVDVVQEIAGESPRNIELEIIRNPNNSGGGFSRNRGIDLTETEFVALLDADDEWRPNHISASLAWLAEHRLDLVFGMPQQFSSGPRYRRNLSPVEFIFVEGGIAQTSSFVFRNQPLLRFDERLLKHQDFDFIMNAFSNGLAIDQIGQITTLYHDAREVRSRVSKQRRPKSSRLFLLKWRRQMSADARLFFLIRFHFYNQGRVDLATAAWALARVARSGMAPSVKLRLYRSAVKALVSR
ncbi:glycosyltransferase family 2 protein [Bradyrhizobium sp. 162]|nr:glycosyltransferase family 2 protein [Bradyrhizobium sp. 23]MCK1510677.1 glycosyltransferase family 2 protein [Bradyrhizobium sp. 18]MCK1630708.1 glycosyltransferase family 2 protein [Bradyrhizobium sp. 162]MCK1694405.1 glycosyltransferase family 2 protein [Bradyrhizobium sp. 144]